MNNANVTQTQQKCIVTVQPTAHPLRCFTALLVYCMKSVGALFFTLTYPVLEVNIFMIIPEAM